MDELVGRSAFMADDGDVVAENAEGIADYRRNEASVEKTQPSIHHLPGTATAIAAVWQQVRLRERGGVAFA